jgi:class 3 adenylate cyclase
MPKLIAHGLAVRPRGHLGARAQSARLGETPGPSYTGVMAVCSTCGQENPDIARFCLACAAPLAANTSVGQEVRKTITVVFSDVVGSTALGEQLDPESLRLVMGRYFEEMRAVLERHGGTVEKFIGDAVVAVFGIPVLHEDDALRAVRAAAEMRDALIPLNDELERERGVRIQVRVGVNTGEVVAGDSARGEAFATGDAVNVAARLEQAARPGEILVGESTHRLVREAVTVESVKPLALKGKGEAVSAVRLLAVPEVTGRRAASPIVGRDHELQLLARTFDGVVRGQVCHLVTVLGSAGVGKSRLVQEFLARRADDATTIVRGRCLSYGEGITFWPIKGVISQAAGLSGDESPQAAREKIRSLVESAPDADLIVERVAETIGVAKTVAGHKGTSWAIGRLFEELARRRPLVVVFDDIHWAEPTFLDLVEAVAAQSRDAPILLLCMARPELLEFRPAWADEDESATRLLLSPLSDDESERLITNLLGAPELAGEVRTRITDAAEGNPLFVEEMVAMLIDQGLLLRRNGSLAASGELFQISLPPTIQAVLAARLDRLGREERAVLERGSVEGKVFHRSAVFELSPAADRPRLDGRLRLLVQQEFLQPDRAGFADEKAFRFRHQLLRDVAYESLSKGMRADLHERFAGWLEEKTGERAEEFGEILGYHLEQAYRCKADLGPVDERGRELATRAANCFGSAGLRAHARGDMWGAGKLLSRALGLLPKDSVARSELLPKLDDALFETGERMRRGISRASLRCFWHRPLGHRWEFKEGGGKAMLRCAVCGKARLHRDPIGPSGEFTIDAAEGRLGGRRGQDYIGGGE